MSSTFERGDFKFQVQKGSILSTKKRDEWESELKTPALPDIVFGDNELTVYVRDTEGTGWKQLLSFKAFEALKAVDFKNGPHYIENINTLREEKTLTIKTVKDLINSTPWTNFELPYANAWRSSRRKEHMGSVVAPYDWTFSSLYEGRGNQQIFDEKDLTEVDMPLVFDKQALLRKEPILFSATVELYEDEMGDNGSSQCTVRLRVMADCFLILLRSYVRVDGLLLRSLETRYMGWLSMAGHHAGIVKEIQAKEYRWQADDKLPAARDLQLMRDLKLTPEEWQDLQGQSPDYVCHLLPRILDKVSEIPLSHLTRH